MSTISLPAAESLPPELVLLRRWVAWKYLVKKGSSKPTKVPLQASGNPAKTTDPSHWTSFGNISSCVAKGNGRFAGVGYVFSEKDEYAGVDLDECLAPDGTVKEWARPILASFAGTYMEVSPSGRGIKVFCKGKLERGRKVEFHIAGVKSAVEAYSSGRFFTCTGRRWENAPLEVTPHQAEIEYALELAGKLAKPAPAAEAAATSTGTITEGSRHEALKKMGVKMRLAGMNGEEILEALLTFNRHRCSPPKPEAEVRDIVKWVAEARFDGVVDPASLPKLVGINGEAVYTAPVTEVRAVVEGFLYPGCSIVCGRPKSGKSWLMLQTALGVAGETTIAGRLRVNQPGQVLYLALEESASRTTRRLKKLTAQTDFLADIVFIYRKDIEAASMGGVHQVEQYLQSHPGVRLVVVDTLLAFQRIERKKTNDLLLSDYNQIQPFSELAAKYNLAFVIVDHTRKLAGDAIDIVSGSSGKTAAPDCVITLVKQKDGATSLLTVLSRDVEEQVYQMQLGEADGVFGWKVLATGDAAVYSTPRKEALDLLTEEPTTPQKLARALGKTEAATRMLLKRLADDGAVSKDRDGKYHAL